MNPLNMRDLLADWEKRGHLSRVKREVSPEYELGAVLRALKGERPLWFEKVKGYSVPVVGGLGGSRKLMIYTCIGTI